MIDRQIAWHLPPPCCLLASFPPGLSLCYEIEEHHASYHALVRRVSWERDNSFIANYWKDRICRPLLRGQHARSIQLQDARTSTHPNTLHERAMESLALERTVIAQRSRKRMMRTAPRPHAARTHPAPTKDGTNTRTAKDTLDAGRWAPPWDQGGLLSFCQCRVVFRCSKHT